MPDIDWLPLITFVLITNLTPGPNVIPAMSLGVMYGLRRAMQFCIGVFLGYIGLMLISAFAASALFAAFPGFEIILRLAGGLYIGWLAISTLRKSFTVDVQEKSAQGFWQGMFMQYVNVKGMFFGLTLFSTFLAPLRARVLWQVLGAVGIAFTAFAAAVIYAVFGSAIRRYLSNEKVRCAISITLSVLLFITALRILGLFDWLNTVFTG